MSIDELDLDETPLFRAKQNQIEALTHRIAETALLHGLDWDRKILCRVVGRLGIGELVPYEPTGISMPELIVLSFKAGGGKEREVFLQSACKLKDIAGYVDEKLSEAPHKNLYRLVIQEGTC